MTTREMKQFSIATLKKLKEERKKYTYWSEDPYSSFWEELEAILRTTENCTWEKLENEHVKGEVWIQNLGEYRYEHRVHRFSWLYVKSQGIVVEEHGHTEPANGGKQQRKLKEWYVFPDGTIEICKKDEKHKLVNSYNEPIYVLSIKSGRNGTR